MFLWPVEDPADLIFDKNMEKVNDFLLKVREFETITSIQQATDMWRIKDMAFQPLRVKLDIQEYIPGMYDILKINPKSNPIPIMKILSVFVYL